MKRIQQIIVRWGVVTAFGVSLAPGLARAQTSMPAAAAPAPVQGGAVQYTKDTYPEALISRPLTLPVGMLQVGAVLDFEHLSVSLYDPTTMTSSTGSVTNEILGISAAYGLTDRIELDFGAPTQGTPFPASFGSSGTSFLLHSSEPGGSFLQKNVSLGATFSALQGAADGKLDVAPNVAFVGDFPSGGSEYGIVVGASSRYKLTPQLYLVGLNDLLNVYVHPSANAPVFLNLNVGVGYQAMPNLAVQLGTDLAVIKISNTTNEFIFKDFIPVYLMGVYAISNKLDGLVSIDYTNVKKGGGSSLSCWGVILGANYRM